MQLHNTLINCIPYSSRTANDFRIISEIYLPFLSALIRFHFKLIIEKILKGNKRL